MLKVLSSWLWKLIFKRDKSQWITPSLCILNIQANATRFFKISLRTWISWANLTPPPSTWSQQWVIAKGPPCSFERQHIWKGARAPPHTETPPWKHALGPNMTLFLSDWMEPQVTPRIAFHNFLFIGFFFCLLAWPSNTQPTGYLDGLWQSQTFCAQGALLVYMGTHVDQMGAHGHKMFGSGLWFQPL